jgi:hypothetical protein
MPYESGRCSPSDLMKQTRGHQKDTHSPANTEPGLYGLSPTSRRARVNPNQFLD